MKKFDVEFSLALHNRTGKFFIGRDIIEDQKDLVNKVYYWRFHVKKTPQKLTSKVLGRLLSIEHKWRRRWPLNRMSGFRTAWPMLHLDPATVCHADLQPTDIVLCHDMGPLTHPDLFHPGVTELYRDAYARVATRRPRMVFVSLASQNAFTALYGASPAMDVIYPPIRMEMGASERELVAGIDRPFLLTVGSVGRRKNQLRSIKAFAQSGLAEQGYQYVVCGAREPGAEDIAVLAAQTPGVLLLNYVDDAQLNWLYANATGFVLVSLLEGFGVPVAEAIAHGLVPLVTRHSVLEEVAGEGALTADPTNVADVAAGMNVLVAMDAAERARRIALLTESITRFSRKTFVEAWHAALVA